MKIGLFIKYEAVEKDLEERLINSIIQHGFEFDNENPQYVFTVGGDGTFLKGVQKYINKLDSVTFIPINRGNLGYFSDFTQDEFDYILSNLDKYVKNSYSLVKAKLNNTEIYAVNEIRIENPFHTLISDVYINDEFLETFRGNGLVVSTSLGSTGYNKSIGGAVIDLKLEVLQLSEIAPINNCLFSSLKSPLVVSKDSKIKFKGDLSNVMVGYDYLVKSNEDLKEIVFSLSDKKVTVLNKKGRALASKLNKTFIERR